MERLTAYEYEQVNIKGLDIYGIGEKNADILDKASRRLAEYEDTGLTPIEINRLNDFEHSQLAILLEENGRLKRALEQLRESEVEANGSNI